MTERRRTQVRVSGRVQGVGFRWWTCDAARAAGLAGWVRNLPGGDVEAEIEGDADDVARLLVALRSGPPLAHVTAIHVQDMPALGEDGFRIAR
ncbi:acylphosphatase [Xylanimonas allomyrinae]|uniref:Acylphosphatase n=1 Tax=Xylanimonas allomyrinae TaxID=2509459 RepID=A0A4V0YE16_9MICO|nr:acylphosphatase [Xylanimonas allomyrinae]QAY62641.1 acylphosphatase [Xylanimonas allomyrinae]